MRKATEYRQHAEQCGKLAKQIVTGEHRDQLLKMAETWEVLASETERVWRYEGVENPSPSKRDDVMDAMPPYDRTPRRGT